MQILTSLLDILFPPRATERQLRVINKLPTARGHYLDTMYLSSFHIPIVKSAITENKFHNNYRACQLLASLLTDWLTQQPKPILIIPIPLHRTREKDRGYNQIAQVAHAVQHPAVQIADGILVRTKHTKPQTDLSKVDRQKNVRGAFSIVNPEQLVEYADHMVVILDDVVTTGATLQAARASLAPHLPSTTRIICLALAH